jgi:leader peptidase (prepilin peptidase) / N-methyltransferase
LEREMVATRPQLPTAFLAAGLAALAFVSYPLGAHAAIAAFVAVVVVTIAVIDIRSFTIPNRLVVPATALVFVADAALYPSRLSAFAVAALAAAGVLLIPNLINPAWMGMGDVKFALLLGAALGWGAIGALMIAFASTLPVTVVAIARRGSEARKSALPFGAFMAFGALVVLIVPHLFGLGG